MFDIRYQLRLNDLFDFTSTQFYHYYMIQTHLETINFLLEGMKPTRFTHTSGRLYIDFDTNTDVREGEYIVIDCVRALDPVNFTKIYNEMWVKDYATAMIKKYWGTNLTKFQNVQLPGGVTLNGEKIYSDAVEELEVRRTVKYYIRNSTNGYDWIMATNSYFTQGTTGEQDLIENLVIEQIKMFGKNVFYMPRTLVNEDTTFTEDALSKFDDAYEIEAYIEDPTGFTGDGDLFTKFGVRISDQVTFIISRKRFTEAVDDNAQLIVEGRPNEGDLVYFPMANKIFKIMFVEHEQPFYQLGKIHVWGSSVNSSSSATSSSIQELLQSIKSNRTSQYPSLSTLPQVALETLQSVKWWQVEPLILQQRLSLGILLIDNYKSLIELEYLQFQRL